MKFYILSVFFFIIQLLSTNLDKNKVNDENITQVVYKIAKPQVDTNRVKSNTNIPESFRSKFRNSMEQMYNIEFGLYYDKNKSLYKVSDRLEINKDDAVLAKIFSGAGTKRFKDNERKEKMFQKEAYGQLFNVTIPYDEYKWNITTETKIINGYKCYKATSIKKEYDKTRKQEITLNPIVWFTPEIPASFGPNGLDGLPGLVLEGSSNGHLFFFATKINFDYKGTEKIERPTKGKEVTELEFLDIIATKLEEIIRPK